MAVQKSKKSRSRRGMRRAHLHLKADALTEDTLTGEVHRRHHITKHGYYKGKQVIIKKQKEETTAEA